MHACVIAFGVCWLAGPLPLTTRCYVSSVTSTAATVAKVDRQGRRLRFVLHDRDGHEVAAKPSGPTALHAVRFEGLRPNSKYRYEVRAAGDRDGDRDGALGGGEFRTAPVDDTTPVRFAAVGDSGALPWWFNFHREGFSRLRPLLSWTWETWQWEVARWIAAQDPHFFVHLGDIVYWRQLYDAHEDAFFRPFTPVLRQAPVYMMVGNHDLPATGEPPFERLFHHPDSGVGRPQRNYTWAWGSVRMVVFDVMDPRWHEPGGAMLGWLQRTLRSASEPWLIVAIHVPCFSVYRTENPRLRDELWPLLHQHGVDLVLSGDDHHYARFRHTDPDNQSPVQLIAGAGGKKLYEFDAADPRLVPGVSKSLWSFLCFEAEGLLLSCRAMSSSQTVIDSWTIDRRRGKLASNIQPARRQRIMKLRGGR